ncbi:MAG: tRNA lysidine(34) synthetase TilS [Flavobacteriaceae bacterium]|nr:tRNA lysidine(34) synthetase TilS [Flavobacteriaceae bacterium]
MLDLLEQEINSNYSYLKSKKILVAISGGVDSVVLAYVLDKLGYNIALAHCNFKLREQESEGDKLYVLELSEILKIPIYTIDFETEKYCADNKVSIQLGARELRYDWFEKLLKEENYDYLVTGHHKDDDLETFFINMLRGTGIDGLCGIPQKNLKTVRPLLNFSREQIVCFAKENNIIWREDSSNKVNKYTRNKIRNEIVPLFKSINPDFLDSFKLTQNNLNKTKKIVEYSLGKIEKQISYKESGNVFFDIDKIKKTDNYKLYIEEVFRKYGFNNLKDIISLLDSQTGKYILSNEYRLLKNRRELVLSKIKEEEIDSVYLLEKGGELTKPINIKTDYVTKVTKEGSNSIYLAGDLLEETLVIRKKQEGDLFYPQGLNGKKKVSKYYKDLKLSLLDKENTWLLCSGNDVVWVIGRRADRRFLADEKANNILKVSIYE